MMPHALPKCVQSSPKPRPHGSARRLHVPPRHAEFSPDHVRVVPVDWYMIPPSASPVLQTQAELDALGTYVAPIVYGGLGNNMYQIAALSVHARKLGIPCVIGFFKHWNREFHSFDMFGGHPAPAPFITLKNVFPNILFANFEPAVELQHTEINNKYAFEISEPDEFVPLPSLEELQERRFVHGYFFNSAYWHPERQHVLDLFDAHPAVKAYVQAYYGAYLEGERETVSLHLRLGYAGEADTVLLGVRLFPSAAWYQNIFEREFNFLKVIYIVVSDDPVRARAFMQPIKARLPGLRFKIIQDNVAVALHVMSRCKHHVLTSSTLSFWGAYLDRNQPFGGRTILHSSFFADHGEAMLPYLSWQVIQ
eukprot:m.285776 g.285776  ORF g.285776 m.285776 type:complete len:365 (+) comp54978_c0_seq8:1501-2595(+)